MSARKSTSSKSSKNSTKSSQVESKRRQKPVENSYSDEDEVPTTKKNGVRRPQAVTELNFISGLNVAALDMLWPIISERLLTRWKVDISAEELAEEIPVAATGRKMVGARSSANKPVPTDGCERTIKTTGIRCGSKPDPDLGRGRICKRCYRTADGKKLIGAEDDEVPATNKKGLKANPTRGITAFTTNASAEDPSITDDRIVRLPVDGVKFIYMVKKTPGILVYKSGNAFQYLGKINEDCDEITELKASDKKIEGAGPVTLGSTSRINYTNKLKATRDRDAIRELVQKYWQEWQEEEDEDSVPSEGSSEEDAKTSKSKAKKVTKPVNKNTGSKKAPVRKPDPKSKSKHVDDKSSEDEDEEPKSSKNSKNSGSKKVTKPVNKKAGSKKDEESSSEQDLPSKSKNSKNDGSKNHDSKTKKLKKDEESSSEQDPPPKAKNDGSKNRDSKKDESSSSDEESALDSPPPTRKSNSNHNNHKKEDSISEEESADDEPVRKKPSKKEESVSEDISADNDEKAEDTKSDEPAGESEEISTDKSE